MTTPPRTPLGSAWSALLRTLRSLGRGRRRVAPSPRRGPYRTPGVVPAPPIEPLPGASAEERASPDRAPDPLPSSHRFLLGAIAMLLGLLVYSLPSSLPPWMMCPTLVLPIAPTLNEASVGAPVLPIAPILNEASVGALVLPIAPRLNEASFDEASFDEQLDKLGLSHAEVPWKFCYPPSRCSAPVPVFPAPLEVQPLTATPASQVARPSPTTVPSSDLLPK